MSAAPLALFLTEFSRTSGSSPRGPRQVHKAPVRPMPQFDAEAEIGPEFDAPSDEHETADVSPALDDLDDDGSLALPEIDETDEEELSFAGDEATDLLEEDASVATEAEAPTHSEAVALPADVEARHQEEIDALNAAHEEAFAAARAEWAATEGERLAAAFTAALDGLRDLLDEKIADVLRPLMAAAIVTRARSDLLDAIDRLIADPTRPAISVKASEDLLAVLKSARPDAPIAWQQGDCVEVTITTEASTVESTLAAALADVAATEI